MEKPHTSPTTKKKSTPPDSGFKTASPKEVESPYIPRAKVPPNKEKPFRTAEDLRKALLDAGDIYCLIVLTLVGTVEKKDEVVSVPSVPANPVIPTR